MGASAPCSTLKWGGSERKWESVVDPARKDLLQHNGGCVHGTGSEAAVPAVDARGRHEGFAGKSDITLTVSLGQRSCIVGHMTMLGTLTVAGVGAKLRDELHGIGLTFAIGDFRWVRGAETHCWT